MASKKNGKKEKSSFKIDLEELINSYSEENKDNVTPDHILAEYLVDCLKAFNKATERRTRWYT